MATFLENAYSLVHQDNTADQPTQQDLKMQLEKGSDESKVETMKKILTIMLNGDSMPNLLMHIIRFVMPSKSKPLKKLLYFYYEICPKLDSAGKLKQEMILVCNGIRNDLQHPNEYIRGNTLRFLCKLREPELIEPLLSSARSCLEHRHAYVRKNAVFAIASIFTHSEALIPDAPELIEAFLENEADHTCKRNAFMALQSISHDRALIFLSKVFDGIPNANELLQLGELEFIRKDAVTNPENKSRYLRLIFDLLEASAPTVVYEAASSLTTLTKNPVAVKAAASKFIELAIKESDNNVKLIVLERVEQLRQKNEGILDDLTMEILRVLSSPDLDVRRKALDLAMEMVSSKNVEEVVMLLKKELAKTVDEQYEKNNEYRSLLVHSIHQCAIKFSEVAENVVGLLMDFIADFNSASAVDVINFVKEVVEKFPKLRAPIVERLVSTLSEVRAGKVYRGALWIVGEYSMEANDIREAWKRIRASLGEIPILASEQRLLEEVPDENQPPVEQVNGHSKPSEPTGSRKVLADGTYASESALTSNASAKLAAVRAAQKPPLRQLILEGDYYLATVLSSTLTKLVMRHSEISQDKARTNALRAEAMLIMISIIRVGQSQFVKMPIDEDSVDRIMTCVRSLAEFVEKKELETVFLDDTRKAFRAMVQVEEKKRAAQDAVQRAKTAVQVDDVVSIRQLAKRTMVDGADEVETDLEKATGGDADLIDLSSKLSRVVQLTGFSDPVYAEAYVKVHQFDIVLDVLLVNQTTTTLQNLSVEFATLGDLKVVERPTTQNLGPHDFQNVQATIKVSSTDTGVIFGNVVYDGSSAGDSNVVILNDVHVDIMDYIQPAQCTETQFRTMWTEFEWENKVNINSKATSLREFLKQLMASTNMSCLTPEASMKGDCQFLSANLYARSVFGEDALANLSVEQDQEGGPVTGFVRIRSRSQGLALSLGGLKAEAQAFTYFLASRSCSSDCFAIIVPSRDHARAATNHHCNLPTIAPSNMRTWQVSLRPPTRNLTNTTFQGCTQSSSRNASPHPAALAPRALATSAPFPRRPRSSSISSASSSVPANTLPTGSSRPPNAPLAHPKAWRSSSRTWTPATLARERAAFFDTRVSGDPQTWAAVQLAVGMARDEDDRGGAQAILQAVGCTVPTGFLADGVWDERGVLYKLPRWVISDPLNLGVDDEEVGEGAYARGGEEEEKRAGKGKGPVAAVAAAVGDDDGLGAALRNVRLRLSDRGTDVVLVVDPGVTRVGELVRMVCIEADIPSGTRVNLAYMGKMLKEGIALESQGWTEGNVVNCLVFA
ncbi:hypothetical protein FH972_022110 [Carpinus fangiana]|uniref:Beta-coat protein n=1 Tax=Carpinus fangiana TaxID=176857 RepID=A0A5N6KRA1_9ROSI|nr:hypothetical protein FH972_022110 [Carpinus fangiana]